MQKIIIIIVSLLFTSCGMLSPITDKERELNYQIDKLYLDYQYKKDSLIIEYYHEKIGKENSRVPAIIETVLGTITAILIIYSFIHIINHFIS